jgi:carbonic anhydrase
MNVLPKSLMDGYERFRAGRLEAERTRYKTLAEQGQSPTTMVIGCCDSRVAPETIFDAGPGELFVVRNVANLVPPYAPDDSYHGTSAALEFAIQVLKVANVVVLGHGRCGGIQAALAGKDMAPLSPGDFIGKWITLAEAAATADTHDHDDRQTATERLSVSHSLENLRTFPFIAERERAGTLALHGAWFDVSLGELWRIDPATGDWGRLTEA